MSARVERVELVQITATVASAWVQVRLQESTGFVSIASDYGHWTYHWMPAHRHDSLGHFLAQIDSGYAGRKFLGARLDVYDFRKSSRRIKDEILADRRCGLLSKDKAASEWNLVVLLEEQGFDSWYFETSLQDAAEFHCTVMDPAWTNFWERLWLPEIRPALAEWPEDKAQARDYERALREGDANHEAAL